jgi:predicted XRE-type DNA-binding protein
MKSKSDLMNKICDHLKANNITQLEASKIIGCQQPRISRLLSGRISEFSLGWLFLAVDKLDA